MANDTTKTETKTTSTDEPTKSSKADKKVKVVDTAEVKTEDSSSKEVGEIKKDLNKTFNVGDTVQVDFKIIEGKKERIQPFKGIVLCKKGEGISKTFTVRRIASDQIGVERIFPMYSPKIVSLEVLKKGKVRRSKLYYLRDRTGKGAKVKELK